MAREGSGAIVERQDLQRESVLRETGSLRVWLLGGFRVCVGGRDVRDGEWRLRKAKSLVKLLALAPGNRLHRERVMDLLWPHLGPEAAANNLNYALYVARRVLEPERGLGSDYLRLEDEWIVLCPNGRLWVDAEAFSGAAEMARRNPDPAAYRAAVERYTGELLPEDRYEDWAEDRRVELRQTYQELLFGLARACEARGETGAAIEALQRLVLGAPAHEQAQAGLMRLYAGAGQRYEAIRQYEQLGRALRQELGAEPRAASRRLYEQILAGDSPAPRAAPDTLPSAEPLARRRHNLPVALTSFIGREREVGELEGLIGRERLVSLIGAGGCGKTRLALAVAAGLVERYPDGVWLVELAALSDPASLPQAVAGALGVHEQQERPLLETLSEELRSKKMVLVLDNCEHLISAAARLTDTLLSRCPGLQVLATSRETLGVPGEVGWQVPTLSLPDPRRPASEGSVEESEAARLFADRVRHRRPGFSLTPANARAVAGICRRLDGVPLAIELAAARVGVLSVEEISTRLDDALGLLMGGGRTLTPRQRSLRGAMDWSYQLLPEEERALFRRLSAFAGGFTLEAAEAVGCWDGLGDCRILDLTSKLVDKSLVVAETLPGAEGAVRYRMLEPVRQYARERLEACGEARQTRSRHCSFYLTLAEEAEGELSRPYQSLWLVRLEEEHDNLRAALGWALDDAGAEAGLGLRLAAALWLFWDTHGHLADGRRWLERALARDGATDAGTRAKALCGAGWISTFQADYDAAETLLEESLALYRELGDKEGIASSLTNLGLVAAFGMREDLPVTELLEEAMSLRPELEDPRTVGNLLIFAGMMLEGPDGGENGTALHEESLTLLRGVRDTRGISVCLTSLGLMALKREDREEAAELLLELLRLSQEIDKKVCIAYSFFGLAGVAAGRDQPLRAARLWAAAETAGEAAGIRISPMARAATNYERLRAAVRDRLGEEAFVRVSDEGRAMTQEEAVEYALAPEQPSALPVPERPAELTRREREVAALVARGLTNRQISTELFLSRRTVDTHLSRILGKLGLDSREQVAARLAEEP